MRKLKFFLLGLCMIFALIACEDPSSGGRDDILDLAPIAKDAVSNLKVTMEDGTTYSVSDDGGKVVSGDTTYNFDSAVSATRSIYKKAVAARVDAVISEYIGFDTTDKESVKFFMAADTATLFTTAVEGAGVIDLSVFLDVMNGKIYYRDHASHPQDWKFYAVDGKSYLEIMNNNTASTFKKLELKKLHSATQGWYGTPDSDARMGSVLYQGITILDDGKTIKAFMKTTDEPTFEGSSMFTKTLQLLDDNLKFLARVKGKEASGGGMGPSMVMTYKWNINGKNLTFTVPGGSGSSDFIFVEDSAISPLSAKYMGIGMGGSPAEYDLTIKEDGMGGTFMGLPFTFKTTE